jgi:hypothetical protein
MVRTVIAAILLRACMGLLAVAMASQIISSSRITPQKSMNILMMAVVFVLLSIAVNMGVK